MFLAYEVSTGVFQAQFKRNNVRPVNSSSARPSVQFIILAPKYPAGKWPIRAPSAIIHQTRSIFSLPPFYFLNCIHQHTSMSIKQSQYQKNRLRDVIKDFPILKRKVNGRPLIYLDSAATSQKPKQVVNAAADFYYKHNSNTHSGVYALAEEATQLYESAREKTAGFIGAQVHEIIFTKSATEAINLTAHSWGETNVAKGDNIVVTIMEHHSNFVPWQELCRKKGAQFRIAPITQEGRLNLKKLYSLVDKRTKLVAITHASNVLGTINPIAEIIKTLNAKFHTLPLKADPPRAESAKILVDGTQAIPHLPANVKKMDCDFYAFSGHKMLGPTGVGVLYAKEEILQAMPPFLTGGHMIKKVTSKLSEWADAPLKFEAGTANIAEVIGLGAAIDYLNAIGMERIWQREKELINYAIKKMKGVQDLIIYGPDTSSNRVGVISFNIKGVHPHDLATLLDQKGIAIRAGHHCAMPLHREALKIEASCRVSFYIYNTRQDIDKFVEALRGARRTLL